jgi:uncharacterized protein YqiB (DUF1249 family)
MCVVKLQKYYVLQISDMGKSAKKNQLSYFLLKMLQYCLG